MAPIESDFLRQDGSPTAETASSTAAVEPAGAPRSDAPQPSPQELRRAALVPYLDEFLERTQAEHESDPVPHFVELGGRPVELGLWERSVLKKSRDPRNGRALRALELLAEAVAYRAACENLLEQIEHGPPPPPAELPAFQDRVITEVAVGIVLQEELEREVNRRIAEGQLADAKALAGFQSGLVQCATDLKAVVGAHEVERAERRALELGCPLPAEADEATHDPSMPVEEGEAPAFTPKSRESELPPWLSEGENADATASAQPEDARSARRRSWLAPMLIVLAFLIVLYGVVMLPRAWRTQLPTLTLDMFDHLEAVQEVSARPPSLFVRLDGRAWDAGSAQDRLELIEKIGRIAGDWGYSGVQVKTDDGVTVGQWMSLTGVRVIPRPAGAS